MYKIARIGLILSLLAIFGSLSGLAAPVDAGFIVNKEDDLVLDQISIIRQNAGTDSDKRILYDGDRVSGYDANTVKIQLNPGFELNEVSPTEVQVVLNRSESTKSFWQRVKELFGMGEPDRWVVYNSSKGEAIREQYPKPGFFCTLLSGQKATFGWENPAKTLVFFDSQGKEIYRKDVTGQMSIDFKPEEIGLEPGTIYKWKVDSSNWDYKVVVLDQKTSRQIRSDLGRFDGTSNNPQVNQLKKIAYLQLVSDVYQRKVDLYWLSYQLAKEVNASDEATVTAVERFKERVAWHLNLQMYEAQ